ncbi:response regulator transcription factor, partial [Sulfurovum sp. bin170]|uniref:response regulator transcription factor n=1 Tax=Sulfurovum sp. bin170 TaxID=2695268 RepID=UPI0013DF8EB7
PFLEEHCARLYIAHNAGEAYRLYADRKPDIIIMDLSVAKLGGVTIAKKVREKDYNTYLIALTEHANRDILLEIVDLHFSSYLIKSSDRTELLKALLKISKKAENGKLIQLEESFFWDSRSNLLFYEDKQIILTRREQKLFELLVEKNGNACSDDEIFFYVWEDEFDRTVTNDSIRTLVKNLRKKIPKKLIENQYAVGYKINIQI